MIDTVLLCMAWAVFGYALALIEHERSASTFNSRSPPSGEHAPLSPVANAISLKHRPDRFACYHCKQFRYNGRFLICWCDWDRREFPALCDEYSPKNGH